MLHNSYMQAFNTFKNILRKILGSSRYTALYKEYYRFVSAYYIMTNNINKVLFRKIFIRENKPRQKYIIWESHLPTFTNAIDIKQYLTINQITYFEGGCTIYIPPQPNLSTYLGQMVNFYPSDAGFKIAKDFEPPDRANYVKGIDYVSWQESKLVGNASDLLATACTLEVLNLGPRIYDLVELKAGETRMTCFVVRHLSGQKPSLNDVDYFLNKIDSENVKSILGTIVPYKNHPHADFLPPTCNNNLIKDDQGNILYIDFQQFVILDPVKLPYQIITSEYGKLSFGDVNFLRNNKPYIYQTIPGIRIAGRRDSAIRWQTIMHLLATAGLTVDNRLVLDICCNSGIILSMALSDGALWALGWDMPQVAEIAMQLQRSLGFSRIDIFKASLSTSYSLLSDIHERYTPYINESIVLYLSAINHIGLISELSQIPWRALVFEGHEGLSPKDYSAEIAFFQEECHSRLRGETIIQDGDSQKRCLLLFVRE